MTCYGLNCVGHIRYNKDMQQIEYTKEATTMEDGRLLRVSNRHGLFTGDVDKVNLILEAFQSAAALREHNEDIHLMRSFMEEAASPIKFGDVGNRVELAIMIADITPH